MANPKVVFDMEVGGAPSVQIVMELFADTTRRTAENFCALCTGEKGPGKSGNPRVIPGFMCQGGDFTNHNVTGGESIYGAKFADENFVKNHTGPEIFSMANAGPGSNSVVLHLHPQDRVARRQARRVRPSGGYGRGKVIKKVGSSSGRTSKPVKIADCGQLS